LCAIKQLSLLFLQILNKKLIYLIRHGQTDFNKMGIVQGCGVDSVLNEEGQHQAAAFYAAYRHIPFDLVVTSSLIRTQQTAFAFLSQKIKHQIIPEFNEINWGTLEGEKPNEENKKAFYQMLQTWENGNYHAAINGGESPYQVQQRMKKGIASLQQSQAQTVLIVSHGRAMRVLLCTLLNLPLSKMESFPHNNTSLYLLSQENGKTSLVKSNSTEHLFF